MTEMTTREPTLERLFGEWWTDDVINVDQFRENGTLVIRAELPGIDPDKDVALTVSDGVLTIAAEWHADHEVEHDGCVRRELRQGSFTRTLTLPASVGEADIEAYYDDGVLEVRVPVPDALPPKKIPISKR
jgi:HSP20 family protein